MESLTQLLFHADTFLRVLALQNNTSIYVITFLIIFAETGFVVTPFLPGDSLLFVLGALAADGLLNLKIAVPLLVVAAIAGDTVNFAIGSFFGDKILLGNSRFIRREHLERTERFYAAWGARAIVLCRFFPVLRTFAPFLAGIVRMQYRTFSFYNIVGALLWITTVLFSGYFFGGLPIVRDHLSAVIVFVVFISFVPTVLLSLRGKKDDS